mgnify:FL=1
MPTMTRGQIIAAGVALVLTFGAGYYIGTATQTPPNVHHATARVYPVTHVVDGDTLEVWRNDGFETVRMLNIDTPERGEAGYDKATEALRDIVGRGPVRLVWESTEGPTRGKFDRLLAYVMLGEVGQTNANVEMVRLGWSPYWTKYGAGRFPEQFKQAEREAREAGRGIWADANAPAGHID